MRTDRRRNLRPLWKPGIHELAVLSGRILLLVRWVRLDIKDAGTDRGFSRKLRIDLRLCRRERALGRDEVGLDRMGLTRRHTALRLRAGCHNCGSYPDNCEGNDSETLCKPRH